MIDCRDAIIDYSNLSQDDPEAEDRYEKTKQCDPFPEIPPALLNSADIYDYVRMTGMLHPFDPSPERLKAASYEACILGECRYWDNDGVEKTIKLKNNTDVLTLPPNSIAFVQVEPYFRLPVYIGIRFNLKIRHVHRGILLGTGPLVDPGYRGKLLIPLHNLTTNEYKFNGGDALIWIEFTKTSQNSLWDSTAKEEKICFQRLGVFNREEAFPRRKADLTPQESLARASPHRSIRSSIPVAMQEAAKNAKTAAEDAAKARESADEAAAHFRTIRRWGILGAIGGAAAIIIAAIGVYADIHNLARGANNLANEIIKDFATFKTKINKDFPALKDKMGDELGEIRQTESALIKFKSKVTNKLPELERQNREIAADLKNIRENDIEVIKSRVDDLESELLKLRRSDSTAPENPPQEPKK